MRSAGFPNMLISRAMPRKITKNIYSFVSFLRKVILYVGQTKKLTSKYLSDDEIES